jgi:hypothetical protein
MGGGLLQLVAYGAQDVYLTGNPQITFFKVVYRRHTNFAMEAIQQTFSGTATYGENIICQISRNGDLINRVYLQVDVPSLTTTTTNKYVNYLGLRLIKNVEITIGGQSIDKHYSDWLYIWNELSLPIGKRSAWELMVGADQDITSRAATKTTLYIPLEFWFCRNVGLALPLIALQYHEVKLKIELESKNNCVYNLNGANTEAVGSTDGNLSNINLWVDYIFLDTDERRKFAQLSHEYLIEQLQFSGSLPLNSGTNRVQINFNHPCKELVWVAKSSKSTSVNQWYNYTMLANKTAPVGSTQIGTSTISGDGTSNLIIGSGTTETVDNKIIYNVEPGFHSGAQNPFEKCLLQLNGSSDRFAEREGNYFSYVQPYQHHTNIPANCGINVYSFALKPEEHQPSGSLNMSRIDNTTLTLTSAFDSAVTGVSVNVYAVNYNVLRILSGMGGLAYAN